RDFAQLPGRMAVMLAVPVAFLLGGVLWLAGWVWMAALAAALASTVALLGTSKPLTEALTLRSCSGDSAILRNLDTAARKRKLDEALRHRDWHGAVEAAAVLAGRGDREAVRALRQALKARYAPAARELGQHYDLRAAAAKGEARKHCQRAALIA